MTRSDYDPFAWLYNKYWGGEFVGAVLPILDRYVFDDLEPGVKVLDVACGTGQLAAALSARGFDMTGVDSSEEMLNYARRNAPKAVFVASDVRELQLPSEFAAAVSTYDSLNYITELSDLEEAFTRVRTALLAGATFLFDLNMQSGYEARWIGTFSMVEEDHVAVTRSSFDAEKLTGNVDITIFRDEGEGWVRTDVSLLQRCYSEAEVRSALSNAGFEMIEVLDAVADLGLSRQVGRSFFVAKNTE